LSVGRLEEMRLQRLMFNSATGWEARRKDKRPCPLLNACAHDQLNTEEVNR
jgi:hypothetical protein